VWYASSQVRDAYRRVTQRIGEAAARRGRSADDVLLVAVTRTASPDEVRLLVEMGHGDFGESRAPALPQLVAGLEEFLGRKRFLARGHAVDLPEVRWHLVGQVPRGKSKQVIPYVRLIHSVDNLRLAEELHAAAARMQPDDLRTEPRPVDILLQVNATERDGGPGLALPAVMHVAEQIDTMVHLRLRGLMVMPPADCDPYERRAAFARAADLFHEMRPLPFVGQHFTVLSMGSSVDFEMAIEEGANMVRVGRAIFGEREG
jgi:pyridoxal phosphate enzyme (YggS family)